MKIVVTGGRNYATNRLCADEEREHVFRVLIESRPTSIIQGGATGADACARTWARIHGVPCYTYVAQWALYGRAAGPRRNEHMLWVECPDLVIAFPGGRGTDHCVREALRLGLRVRDER